MHGTASDGSRGRRNGGRLAGSLRRPAARLLRPAVAALLAACATGVGAPPPDAVRRATPADDALARGDLEQADRALKLAIQADPLDAASHHALACLLARRGERDQALVGFRRAYALDPANAAAAFNTGTILLGRGEPVEAARWLEAAQVTRAGVAPTTNNLAKAYFLAGLPELALAAYEETLRHDPANSVALRGLAAISAAAGLPDAAASYRERLARLGSRGGSPVAAVVAAPGGATPGGPVASPQVPSPSAPAAGTAAPDPEVETLRALLRDLPHVAVERRGGRLAVTGWTRGTKERAILTRVLAGWTDVTDLVGDDTGDPGRMIEVDATIFVVVELDSSSVGFNFLRFVNTNFTYFATQHANDGTGFTSPATVGVVSDAGQQGWMLSASVDYDVNIANAVDDRVAILARPHLTALSGTPAKFLAGGEYVFQVAGNISGDIKPYPFGTTLTVTPTLLRTPGGDGSPRIHVNVEAGRTSVLSILTATASEGSTVFDKVQVSSEAVLDVGQTLILSGLSQRESRTGHSGVPVLRDIPILKYLFSSTTTTESNTSVVILLTPRDPGYQDRRNREALAGFVAKRRAYVAARAGGEEAMRRFVEQYPDWAELAPNRFASHFFLLRTSDVYRALSGEDLTTESLEFGLLNGDGGSGAR